MGLRLIRDDRTVAVLDAVGIATQAAEDVHVNAAARLGQESAGDLSDGSPGSVLVAPEAVNTTESGWTREARVVVITRAEALLVQSYQRSLGAGEVAARHRCSVGLTDLHVSLPGGFDLVEAKSSAGHSYVRDALGRLLDHAHAITDPITHLVALFPERPAQPDVALLHRYGVDVVYRVGAQRFRREGAPEERRSLWASASV